MLPTPTMKPCPGMRRGTEWTVPIIPGFVIDAVVPAKSSGEILLPRTFTMRSSYARQKPAKSRVSASFMFGTSNECVPSRFCTSTARPRLTCWWRTTTGLPPSVAYAEFRAGEVVERTEHRVRDEMREAHLARTGARELVVQDLAIDLEQLRGDDAHRRGGRDRRGSPPCSRPCGRQRRAAARARRPRAPVAPVAARRQERARVSPELRRGAAGGRGCRSGSSRGSTVGGRRLAVEVLAPVGVDRGRVLEVALVQLLGQAGVRTEIVETAHHGTSFDGRLRCAVPLTEHGSTASPCSRVAMPVGQGRAVDQRRRSSATWNARSSDCRALSRGSQLVS